MRMQYSRSFRASEIAHHSRFSINSRLQSNKAKRKWRPKDHLFLFNACRCHVILSFQRGTIYQWSVSSNISFEKTFGELTRTSLSIQDLNRPKTYDSKIFDWCELFSRTHKSELCLKPMINRNFQSLSLHWKLLFFSRKTSISYFFEIVTKRAEIMPTQWKLGQRDL